jgi:hypothetical protein
MKPLLYMMQLEIYVLKIITLTNCKMHELPDKTQSIASFRQKQIDDNFLKTNLFWRLLKLVKRDQSNWFIHWQA